MLKVCVYALCSLTFQCVFVKIINKNKLVLYAVKKKFGGSILADINRAIKNDRKCN